MQEVEEGSRSGICGREGKKKHTHSSSNGITPKIGTNSEDRNEQRVTLRSTVFLDVLAQKIHLPCVVCIFRLLDTSSLFTSTVVAHRTYCMGKGQAPKKRKIFGSMEEEPFVVDVRNQKYRYRGEGKCCVLIPALRSITSGIDSITGKVLTCN